MSQVHGRLSGGTGTSDLAPAPIRRFLAGFLPDVVRFSRKAVFRPSAYIIGVQVPSSPTTLRE